MKKYESSHNELPFEIVIQNDKCIRCGLCVEICPLNILVLNENQVEVIDYKKCNGCKLCENKCKFGLILIRTKNLEIDDSISISNLLNPILQNKIPKLVFLNIHITHACNLKCIHCFSKAKVAYEKEVNSKEIFNVVDDAIGLGLRSITLTGGGEPLLRKELCYETIKMASDRNIHTRICTNGTMLDENCVKKLKEADIGIVQVSLDSHVPEIHDEFRGMPGTFKKVIKGIKLLNDYEINVMIRPTLHSKNYNRLPEFISFCSELGASHFRLGLLRPFGHGKYANEWYVNKSQTKEAIGTLIGLREELWGRLNIIADECYTHLLNPMPTCRPNSQLGCRAGVDKIVISSDGSIIPCDTFNLIVGNIRSSSIKDIWKESPVLRDLRDIKNLKGRCGNCDYLWACGGGCRAVAYEISADIFAEDSLCWHQP